MAAKKSRGKGNGGAPADPRSQVTAHRPGTENSGSAAVEQQKAAAEALAARIERVVDKAREYGEPAFEPPRGTTASADDPQATASTVTEGARSDKLGDGSRRLGHDPAQESLQRAQVDSSERALTTNQGVPVATNQDSLKAGLRGPSLLEDFILREKLTHFDHERIPERVVHARGSGAHGYFECYEPLTELTRASLFAEAGKRTPAFVRFSTVAGERGSKDTARDVRGFAVKFYTDEGVWDLVGNNIPVFFIQDAIKFPDLVHALKPEPHHQMPQAASAHDTFWDFVSLMPESTHMLMWAMSDRALPRSYRMMQGFGVHTFRFVNAVGRSSLVKFHWLPKAGTHALLWDEAVKISGADPDYHRRDLWEAIEAGAFPEWELAVQVFSEDDALNFSFDVLDATKLVPEELVPLRTIGRLVLNRNPDNFFAETEQVAFCTAHLVPGLDFTEDPLLAGRVHSYVDTQISRLGGPNFHELPINRPVVGVHNNQRDGMHRQAINRGRVSYEPNSLAGGCPFQVGEQGFRSYAAVTPGPKARGRSIKFAEHYHQARLFWHSQTPVEQAHIVKAYRFELTKVQTVAIRRRMVAGLRNVDESLASRVAEGLGLELPPALPLAWDDAPRPEIDTSAALSMFARPGDGALAGRRIALLVSHGVDAQAVVRLRDLLIADGPAVHVVGATLDAVSADGGGELEVDTTMEANPSVLYDAVAVLGGATTVAALQGDGLAMEFLRDQFRHCKPMLLLGPACDLLASMGVTPERAEATGVVLAEEGAVEHGARALCLALAQHRYFDRESDPPLV